MLSSQIKSNEIVFGSCNKDLLEEIIFYGIGLGADFVEIFIENTDNSSVLAEEDFITSVSPSFGRGAGIRIFKGKKDGFVSTNDLTKHGLMRSVSQAIEMLDITDTKKREVFNGLDKHRDYSLSKKKWINEVPSIHEISEKLLVITKSLKKNNKIICFRHKSNQMKSFLVIAIKIY